MGKDFYDAEISRLISDVSRASANNALRDLDKWGITKRYFIGNIALNRVESSSLFIREYRRFIYVTELVGFVEEVKNWTSYISIFGEYLDQPFGDTPIADIFIVTEKVERVSRILKQCPYSKFLNLIIYTPEQFDWFKNESPSIWSEVQKGLRLI